MYQFELQINKVHYEVGFQLQLWEKRDENNKMLEL